MLGLLWVLPLAYAVWTAFHPAEYSTRFAPLAPLTLENFANAWQAAPFARYFANTIALVTMILAAQLVLVTLAAYAFARFEFPGRNVLFALVLVQLMVMPDVLIVENYQTMAALGLKDTILAIGLPYMASAFGIFLLRQTFKTVPRELDEAARIEGCGPLAVLWKVYVPAGAADLPCVRARQRQLPLEQLPLAAHHHQFRRVAAAYGRPAGVFVGRPGDRLVDHHRGDAADDRAAADRLSSFPAAVRAKLHARGDSMKLITWNVQWCRGVDGRVDPARIVAEAKKLADFDVLCLQEIADNFPDPRLAGNTSDDQFAALAALLPGFTAVPGVAVDHPAEGARRRRFGNLILSRLPVCQAYRHLLPSPIDAGLKGMPRIAVEAVVGAPFGEVRVITTHLEYYSQLQRSAQIDALRAIYAEGHGYARAGTITDTSGGPFHTFLRPAATVITGDFNLEPDDPLHARMMARFADGPPPLVDAWEWSHPGVPHESTFKIYEKEIPGEPELHCDFIFVSDGLKSRVTDVRVDRATQAADHQPVILTLE